MKNDEYIRNFLLKHNFNGVIQVHSKYGTTWDNVVSITLNPIDNPYKFRIPISDIILDVLSDLPNDAFTDWCNYINKNGYIEYSVWLSKNIYIPKIERNLEFENTKKHVDEVIDKIIEDLNNKYNLMKYEDSYEDSDEFDEDEES